MDREILTDIQLPDSTLSLLHNLATTKQLPHLLLYGPPGTGKTTTALSLAAALLTPTAWRPNTLELNASDERGIATVRTRIRAFASQLASAAAGRLKIIILDEADALTGDAQTALRRVMEEFSGSTRFIFLCNQVSRIIEPIVSRCAKIRFGGVEPLLVRDRLRFIADSEKVCAGDRVLEKIAQLADGDMRSAINLLQSASIYSNDISDEVVDEVSGMIPDAVITHLYSLTHGPKNAFLPIVGYVEQHIMRPSYCPREAFKKIHETVIDDNMVSDEKKAQICVEAGKIDGRSGNEQVHLLAYLSILFKHLNRG